MDSSEIIKQISAIAKAAAPLAAAIPFTGIVKRMLGPAADELAEMWRDQVRLYRYERQLKCVEKAEKMAQAAGFTPQAVPPKILFPLLEGASFEDSEDLHTMWAALLANASSEATTDLVRPSFIELLRMMTPDVAKVVNVAFDDACAKSNASRKPSTRNFSVESEKQPDPDAKMIDEIMGLTQIDLGTYRQIYRLFGANDRTPFEADLPDEPGTIGGEKGRHRFAVAMDELHRMRMWSVEARNSNEHYYLTALATQFVIVCRQPKPKPGV